MSYVLKYIHCKLEGDSIFKFNLIRRQLLGLMNRKEYPVYEVQG